MKRNRIIATSLIVIAAAFVGLGAYAAVKLDRAKNKIDCERKTAEFRRHYFESDELKEGPDGREYFSDGMFDEFLKSNHGRCESWGRFIYSPKTPSGERIPFDSGESHIIAWTACPCRGEYIVITDQLAGFARRDDQISWYFQKFANDLSEEELRRENRYRKATGRETLELSGEDR